MVRYVYRCGCGARGTVQREDDSHDGAVSACTTCGAEVVLEWDGGVTFEFANATERGLS